MEKLELHSSHSDTGVNQEYEHLRADPMDSKDSHRLQVNGEN